MLTPTCTWCCAHTQGLSAQELSHRMHAALLEQARQGGSARLQDNPSMQQQLLYLSKVDPKVRSLRTHCMQWPSWWVLTAWSCSCVVCASCAQKWRDIKVLELALKARAEASVDSYRARSRMEAGIRYRPTAAQAADTPPDADLHGVGGADIDRAVANPMATYASDEGSARSDNGDDAALRLARFGAGMPTHGDAPGTGSRRSGASSGSSDDSSTW